MEHLRDIRRVQRFDRPDKQPMMRIALEGKIIDRWLPGAYLEAAFRSPNGDHLVFSTDDVPYEEGLNIIFLAANGRLLDVKMIAQAYATGDLHNLRVENPHTIFFSFYECDLWKVTVPLGSSRSRPRLIPRFLWRGLRVKRLV